MVLNAQLMQRTAGDDQAKIGIPSVKKIFMAEVDKKQGRILDSIGSKELNYPFIISLYQDFGNAVFESVHKGKGKGASPA